MSEIETFAKSIVKAAARKLSPIEFLGGQVRKMEREDLEYLATAYLLAQLKNRQRHEVLEVERAAVTIKQKRAERAYNSPEAVAAREALAREQAVEDERRNREFWASMNETFNRYKAELHTEWTEELLSREFALGDGTSVRWGDATRENHEYRVAMHKKNAMAGLEGAARHMEAIETLDSLGVVTLREAVRQAA